MCSQPHLPFGVRGCLPLLKLLDGVVADGALPQDEHNEVLAAFEGEVAVVGHRDDEAHERLLRLQTSHE